MHKFTIIKEFVRVAAPGDILFRTIANHSSFPGLRIARDRDISLPVLTNNSVLNHLRITTGDEPNIEFPTIENVSTLNPFEVQLSGPDGFIELPTIENVSTLNPFEVQLSGPDGFIRFTTIVNESVLNAPVVNPDEDEDAGEGIAMGSIGETVI